MKLGSKYWRLVVFLLVFPFTACMAAANKAAPERFGVYTSRLDGRDFRLIVSDSYRELNHARVSPNRKWITFSRFNNRKPILGLAEEKNGYTNTEIMIVRMDGSGLKSLIPPRKNIINVNSYWTPDGKGLIYMSNDNPDKRKLRIKHIDIATRRITNVSPADIPWVSDPHQVDRKIVFPATIDKRDVRSIWLMKLGSGRAEQITHPAFPKSAMKRKPPPGDSDPKLSPDGTKVAFTRHFGKGNFHTIVLDLKTGREKDISRRVTTDVMPEWSSDGRLLAYWHVDMKNIRKIGIYTIRPNGKGRRQVPLPRGYHFKMPSFFPGDGSGKDARIIFTGKKVPGLK